MSDTPKKENNIFKKNRFKSVLTDNTRQNHNRVEKNNISYADWEEDYSEKYNKNSTSKNNILKLCLIILLFLSAFTLLLYFITTHEGFNKRPSIKQNIETPDIKVSTSSTKESIPEVSSDPLGKINFDFSPILNNKVSRKPQLPNKVKKKIISDNADTASNELSSLWDNGKEQGIIEDVNKTANEYLPPWRQYAIGYAPTNRKPVYSVILEYDPQKLNVGDLPKGGGYNVIIPGFMEYSQAVSKILTENGYELMLYLPMGDNSNALNFKAITSKSTFNDIRNAVNFHTSQLGGKGFIGFMGRDDDNHVSQSLSKMNFTMSLLGKQGYAFIDNVAGSNNKSLAYAAATGQSVPALKAEHYIESVVDEFPAFINKVKLDGQGIAVIKATLENVAALKKLQKAIKNEGVVRIPVSGILKHKLLGK